MSLTLPALSEEPATCTRISSLPSLMLTEPYSKQHENLVHHRKRVLRALG